MKKIMQSQIDELTKKIEEIGKHTENAVMAATISAEAAKGSAAIAYNASVDNVKSNKTLEAKLDAYILQDNEWKKRAEPAIQMGIDARGASKSLLWLGGIILVLGGAYKIIVTWFTKQQ